MGWAYEIQREETIRNVDLINQFLLELEVNEETLEESFRGQMIDFTKDKKAAKSMSNDLDALTKELFGG